MNYESELEIFEEAIRRFLKAVKVEGMDACDELSDALDNAGFNADVEEQ